MRNTGFLSLAIIVAVGLTGSGLSVAAQQRVRPATLAGPDIAVGAGAEFQATLAKLDAAQQEFHSGRPAAVKAFWSHADDVTLIGGAGGAIEKGWQNVSSRLDWASAQYSKGTQANERIMATVSGDLAYVVQLEHIRYQLPHQAQEVNRDYRVTMVFRREAEGWRIVHRQADTQMAKQTPR